MTRAGRRDRAPGASRIRAGRWLLVAYGALLAVSHGVRGCSSSPAELPADARSADLRAVAGERLLDRPARLVWRDLGPAAPEATLLLVHGSPGRGEDFETLEPTLASRFRLVVPDLPGFGRSERAVPDLSSQAQARYLLELLDDEGIGEVHVVGFSLGGPVALHLADLAPGRVASVVLLGATGVQELELLGDYHLNHMVHGLQLGILWAVAEAVPHMGLLDGALLDVAYARNFYETDQRPVRALLAGYEGPMLIVHGRRDPLVPPAAAREHHRIVPQSELLLLDSDHFMVFRPAEAAVVAERIGDFIGRVVRGEAPARDRADPARIAEALAPFDPSSVPPPGGLALAVLMALIAAATLVSEDLTCVTVGWMAASGRIGFAAGTMACLAGIFAGDLLLFLAGRWLGTPALRRVPLRWMVPPERVERSRRWLEKRGPVVILASRLLPGARLPTYVAAGAAGVRVTLFGGYFLAAAAVWTPALVGLAMILGRPVRAYLEQTGRLGLAGLAVVAIVALAIARLGVPLATHRGRRLLLGRLLRLTRWEFWPLPVVYLPVAAYVAWLGLRFRHPTLFTAANPAIPHGGVVGESKSAILALLGDDPERVARHRLIPAGPVEDRMEALRGFLAERGLGYPVVLKPDVGERGRDVRVARTEAEARAYLGRHARGTIAQEYVPGREVGVFYARLPGEPSGRIFSVTDKRFPQVVGDGRRTLEELILDDERAVALARVYVQANADRIDRVPAAGEPVRLVEVGTHCRGAIFLDGRRLITPSLEEAVDHLSRRAEGFFFGRYDLRFASENDLIEGRGFKVIELNGVTSEATHVYDPAHSVLAAYRTLFRQWRLAFEIGRRNRLGGHRPTGPLALLRATWRAFAAWHDAPPPEDCPAGASGSAPQASTNST